MDLHSHRDHFPPIYMLDTFDVLVPKPRISEMLGPVIDVKNSFLLVGPSGVHILPLLLNGPFLILHVEKCMVQTLRTDCTVEVW